MDKTQQSGSTLARKIAMHLSSYCTFSNEHDEEKPFLVAAGYRSIQRTILKLNVHLKGKVLER